MIFLRHFALKLLMVVFTISLAPVRNSMAYQEDPEFFNRLSDDGKENVTKDWNYFFDGTPIGLLNQLKFGEELPIRNWVRGYSRCQEGVDALFSATEKYDLSFRSGDNVESEHQFEIIQRLLRSGTDCHSTYWTAYLAAVALMGPKLEFSPRLLSTQDYRYEFAIITVLLGNFEKLKELTPEERLSLAAHDKESLWLKEEQGNHFITAFYDCVHSAAYLDSTLKPFNLAASLYHELDHFYRDKAAKHTVSATSAADDSTMDVVTYLALDELTATIGSGFYQRRMLHLDPQMHGLYNHNGNEFNLFQLGGPLDQSTQYVLNTWPETDNDQPRFLGFSDPGDLLFILGAKGERKDDETALRFFCEMNQIILSGYFGYNRLVECENRPFFYWDSGNSIGSYLLLISLYRDEISPGQYTSVYTKQFDNFILHISHLAFSLSYQSKNCQEVVKAQKLGDLDNYLGTKLMQGGRGGNGGIRPILPCARIHF